MKITSPTLITLNGDTIILIPDDRKFPYVKIKVDYIICSHNTWKENKYTILKNCVKSFQR